MGAVHKDRTHPDKDTVIDPRPVYHGTMANGDEASHLHTASMRYMKDAGILHIGEITDHHTAYIRPDDRLVPHARTIAQFDKVAQKISRDVIRGTEWTCRIVKVDPDLVYLNAGRLTGLQPGDKLNVYARGREIIDPITKRSLGFGLGGLKGTPGTSGPASRVTGPSRYSNASWAMMARAFSTAAPTTKALMLLTPDNVAALFRSSWISSSIRAVIRGSAVAISFPLCDILAHYSIFEFFRLRHRSTPAG